MGFIFFVVLLISSVNNFSRQASGANIKIADLDEASQDRHVTISGTPEQIQLAEFLIHSR